MNIACLSGKGGAGKTFVAVNLAVSAGESTYIDCDVEEPNGRIFLQPEQVQTTVVNTKLPQFDAMRCVGCRRCVQFCQFHALVYIKGAPMVFSEVCHHCGGCQLVCPNGAISEIEQPIGVLETGQHGKVTVVTGVLQPGQASGVPVIRQALLQANGLTILDGPPGSACTVMETVMASDYCVLVAEPTAFGLHNLKMVHQLVTLLQKPCGVIINKETIPYSPLEAFCKEHHLEILDRITYDPTLAKQIANGVLVCEQSATQRARFAKILAKIGGC